MHRHRSIQLSEPENLDGKIRLLSDEVSLAEGQTESWETLTRVITFKDPFYGKVVLTADMLSNMIKNFNDNVYGQELAIDVSHRPADGAGGFIREMQMKNGKMRGRIGWTPKGIKAVREDGFRYFSVDYTENYEDPETGKEYGPLLFGAALTTRPRVKHLDPIDPERLQLSLDGYHPAATALSPHLEKKLFSEIAMFKQKFIKLFSEALKGIKSLSEDAVSAFQAQFALALDSVTDEAQAQILLDTFTATAETTSKQLADAGNAGKTIKLDFSGLQDALPKGGGLSKDDVIKLMDDERAAAAKQLADAEALREQKVKRFTDALEAHEGFDDDIRKKLSEGTVDLITGEMTDQQIDSLAQSQIRLGDHMAAQSRLLSMGYEVSGTPRVSVDQTNEVNALQAHVDKRLGLDDKPDSRRFEATGGKLQDENKRFAEKVLAQFDQARAADLHKEHKMLAGGSGVVSDLAVPATFERTVIREALYNLVGLNFVDVDTATFSASHIIPYSYRDTTGAGRDDTRIYEGQPIPRAGVIQTSEMAYPIPQKISFEVSDELRYLTSNGVLNWDALAQNQENASRIIREDTEQLIHNETLRSSDEYLATAVTDEDLELQADGAKTIFVLANFPVVRPRKVFDLKGTQVGNTLNPVTVSYSGSQVEAFDGTGNQAAGTYYVLNYNLGEIYLVNEAGVVQTPADTTAYTISYSYSNNVYRFDTDLGGATLEDHWDTFLYRYGLRKSVIEDERYHMANFGLMSGTLSNSVEQAKRFAANFRRPGTELALDGNLGRIKDIPNFKSTAPGLHMGDVRCIIGERGQTRFRMMKGWQMGELENQTDNNGKFTGKKHAYGDQFIVLHTPTQLKRAYTSILAYSSSARVAR